MLTAAAALAALAALASVASASGVWTTFSASIVECTLFPIDESYASTGGACQILRTCEARECPQAINDVITNLTAYGGNTYIGFVDFKRYSYL